MLIRKTERGTHRVTVALSDLAEVNFMSSIGIGMIVRLAQSIQKRNGNLVLLDPQSVVGAGTRTDAHSGEYHQHSPETRGCAGRRARRAVEAGQRNGLKDQKHGAKTPDRSARSISARGTSATQCERPTRSVTGLTEPRISGSSYQTCPVVSTDSQLHRIFSLPGDHRTAEFRQP